MRGPSLIILRSPRLERLQALLVASGAAPAALHELPSSDLPGSFPAAQAEVAGETEVKKAADGHPNDRAGAADRRTGSEPAAWPSTYASSALVYDAAALGPAEARILGRARNCGALAQLIGIGGGGELQPDEQLTWPLDLAQLEALAARAWSPDGDVEPPSPMPMAPPNGAQAEEPAGTTEPAGNGLDDLRRIERILRGIDDRRLLQPDQPHHDWEARQDHREDRRRADAGAFLGAPKAPKAPSRGPGLARSLRRSVGPFRRAQDASGGEDHRAHDRAHDRTRAVPRDIDGPPRTAFLRTHIEPARRPHRGNGAPDGAPDPALTAGALDGHTQLDGAPANGATAESSPMGERVLRAALEPGAPLLTREELDAFFGPDPELPADLDRGPHGPATANVTSPTVEAAVDGPGAPLPTGTDEPSARTAGAERPSWLKAQVADLADIVQALDLRARMSHAHTQIGDELARLRQFTRTLGIVASPPPRGDRTFDFASFVEEQLGAAAGRSVDAPRLLFRRDGAPDAGVRADKMLLALALDALLQTAIACATSGDVVRVELLDTDPSDADPTGDDAAERELCLRIDFPRGPLAGRGPDAVLRPYALRAELPTIGPNALPAAGAIAVGQGGDLQVEDLSGQRTAFVLTLPALSRRSVTEQG